MAQQFILTIEDNNTLSIFRKLASVLNGVTLTPIKKKKTKSSYEESLEDIKAGRVTTWESTDAYFKAMGAKK
ncbi:MAG: hypothetical protein LUD17_03740 [Bacteroidales bacterium]|nr:hypothetical protein [Bacteroidales bacterium]